MDCTSSYPGELESQKISCVYDWQATTLNQKYTEDLFIHI
ncbi:hypothetical protein NC653_025846 [Populus alba x Populus x berolinensis]|uniref:Uncharacterized protein n=1 Tax=Populus alba x Populus x berolinensis TaxID=444605 RepID=A0AAD6Q8J1_9ROSI|nr:hypothetical protein NC653_025846 [Populus alba x Populus x berolinensis]